MNNAANKRPAVFLDRDGTLLTERGYLSDPRRIFFYARVLSSLRRLNKAGFALFVITNQSGIGRGYFGEEQFHAVNRRFVSMIEKSGARIDGVFYCPHHPDAHCRCRKPKPYLLKKAARSARIDLSRSFVVGDQMTDIGMAKAARVQPILVLTGSGRRHRREALKRNAKITRNFQTAVDFILSSNSKR